VVVVGFTVMLVLFKTLPMLLSIAKLAAVPPASVHDRVADSPEFIATGFAVKLEITGTAGGGLLTVITEGDELAMLPLEAVMLAVPAETGVTVPLELTVATAVLLEAQTSVAVMGFEYWSRVVAVSCCVAPPAIRVAVSGESVMVFKAGGGGFTVTVTDFVTMPEMFDAVSV